MNRELKNHRHKDESYEEYVARRKRTAAFLKEYLRGRMLWPSSRSGTYRRAA